MTANTATTASTPPDLSTTGVADWALRQMADQPQYALLAWAETVWGDDPDADAHVSICSEGAGKSFTGRVFPAADLDPIYAHIAHEDTAGRHVWASLATMGPVAKGRGTRADVRHMPVLVADIDVAGRTTGVHKAEETTSTRAALPTEAEGLEIIRRLDAVLPVTMVVDSGFGFHAYVSIAQMPLEQAQDFMRRWKQVQADIAAEMDRHIDVGVAVDLCRVLRVPGTHNRKSPAVAPLARIIHVVDQPERLTAEQLDAALPELRTARRSISRRRATTAVASSDRDWSDWTEPEHRAWLRQVDPTDLLLSLEWETVGDRLKAPGSSSETSAQVRDTDEGFFLFINSETVIADWNLEDCRGEGGGVRITTWTVLVRGICAGDRTLADRIVKTFVGDPDGLSEWVERVLPNCIQDDEVAPERLAVALTTHQLASA